MLALFLNHPPLFVAGEMALGLSLALFAGALIAAVIRGAPRIAQCEAGHPSATSGRRPLGETVYPRTNVPGLAQATRPAVRSKPRSALRQGSANF
jgi:hypothetical protein